MVTVPIDRRVQTRSGVDLRVLDWQPATTDGAACDVLAVHGLSSNAHLWDGVARRLADLGHHVVAVDQRGHGASDKPGDGFDAATLTADLVDVASATGLDRPLAMGQSWGGNVVLALALRHPDAVRGVVAVDGGTIDPATRFADADAAWAALAPPDFRDLRLNDVVAHFDAAMPGWPAEALLGQLANLKVTHDGRVVPNLSRADHERIVREMYADSPARHLGDVQVPVLLLPVANAAAREDEIAAAVAALPRGAVHWFRDRHHDVHAQAPDEVVAVVRAALADGRLD